MRQVLCTTSTQVLDAVLQDIRGGIITDKEAYNSVVGCLTRHRLLSSMQPVAFNEAFYTEHWQAIEQPLNFYRLAKGEPDTKHTIQHSTDFIGWVHDKGHLVNGHYKLAYGTKLRFKDYYNVPCTCTKLPFNKAYLINNLRPESFFSTHIKKQLEVLTGVTHSEVLRELGSNCMDHTLLNFLSGFSDTTWNTNNYYPIFHYNILDITLNIKAYLQGIAPELTYIGTLCNSTYLATCVPQNLLLLHAGTKLTDYVKYLGDYMYSRSLQVFGLVIYYNRKPTLSFKGVYLNSREASTRLSVQQILQLNRVTFDFAPVTLEDI